METLAHSLSPGTLALRTSMAEHIKASPLNDVRLVKPGHVCAPHIVHSTHGLPVIRAGACEVVRSNHLPAVVESEPVQTAVLYAKTHTRR